MRAVPALLFAAMMVSLNGPRVGFSQTPPSGSASDAGAQSDPSSSNAAAAPDTPDSGSSSPADDIESIVQDEVEQKLQEQWRTEVYRWTLREQFDWAKRLIEEHPDSPLARRAQRIIADYERFVPQQEARRRVQLERTRAVRRYWQPAHQQWGQVVQRWEAVRHTRDVNITNTEPAPLEGGLTVLFEVRLPGTRWCGPYRLPGGRSSRFFDQAEIRFIDPDNPEQLLTRTLPVNTDWEFRRVGDHLQLFPAGTP